MVTVSQFRTNFSEFASVTAFPNSTVQFWLTVADKFLARNGRWGCLRDLGVQLFAAHNIVIEARARQIAVDGGIPGTNSGAISEKHVGPAGVSYDTASAAELGAGHWNLTVYGTRLIHMARMFGAGPVQIGIGISPPFVGGGGGYGAWSGPPPWPLPSGTGFSS